MIDATSFEDAETATITALQERLDDDVITSNETPPTFTKLVTVAYAGGGYRRWGEAAANVGIRVYAQTDADCRDLTKDVQDALAVTSNDVIEGVLVPAGGGSVIPGQQPPFQRYFVATVLLRGLTDLS